MKTIEEELVEKLVSLDNAIRNYEIKSNISKSRFEEYKENLESYNIGSRQYEIMHLILNRNCNKVSEFSKFLDLSKSSLSLIISKMVSNNIIMKMYDTTEDSRNVVLEVTEKGRKIYNDIKNEQCNSVIIFLNELDGSQRNLFDNAVLSLTKTFAIFSVIPITKEHTNAEIADIIFQNLFILKTPFEKFFREVKANIKDELTLTEKEIKILVYLSKIESSTPTEIAELFKSSESTISLQLKELLKTNHVTKTKSIIDSRKNIFSITELGLETVNREFNLVQKELINHAKIISEPNKRNIIDGLNNLLFMFKVLSDTK